MAKKKFAFKFEKILDHKLRLEENAKNALATANAKLNEEMAYMEELKHTFASEKKKLSESNVGIIDVHRLQNFQHYTKQMYDKMANQKKVIEKCENDVEKRKEEMIEATMERKIFEKLKEKHKAAFEKEVLRKEQNFIDEMAIQTFIKKGREND